MVWIFVELWFLDSTYKIDFFEREWSFGAEGIVCVATISSGRWSEWTHILGWFVEDLKRRKKQKIQLLAIFNVVYRSIRLKASCSWITRLFGTRYSSKQRSISSHYCTFASHFVESTPEKRLFTYLVPLVGPPIKVDCNLRCARLLDPCRHEHILTVHCIHICRLHVLGLEVKCWQIFLLLLDGHGSNAGNLFLVFAFALLSPLLALLLLFVLDGRQGTPLGGLLWLTYLVGAIAFGVLVISSSSSSSLGMAGFLRVSLSWGTLRGYSFL